MWSTNGLLPTRLPPSESCPQYGRLRSLAPVLTRRSVVDKRASADEATAYVVDKRASADEATA